MEINADKLSEETILKSVSQKLKKVNLLATLHFKSS